MILLGKSFYLFKKENIFGAYRDPQQVLLTAEMLLNLLIKLQVKGRVMLVCRMEKPTEQI